MANASPRPMCASTEFGIGLDEHARQIVLSLTIPGVELHRPAEVRDRLLTPARLKSSRSIIAGCRERGAEVPVRHGGVGIEPQRFAKLRNRLVELASGSERDAQRVVQVSRLGND